MHLQMGELDLLIFNTYHNKREEHPNKKQHGPHERAADHVRSRTAVLVEDLSG